MEQMLSVKDVADRLNISKRLVRWYIIVGTTSKPDTNRKLNAHKMGRDWRVKPDDLQEFINNGK